MPPHRGWVAANQKNARKRAYGQKRAFNLPNVKRTSTTKSQQSTTHLQTDIIPNNDDNSNDGINSILQPIIQIPPNSPTNIPNYDNNNTDNIFNINDDNINNTSLMDQNNNNQGDDLIIDVPHSSPNISNNDDEDYNTNTFNSPFYNHNMNDMHIDEIEIELENVLSPIPPSTPIQSSPHQSPSSSPTQPEPILDHLEELDDPDEFFKSAPTYLSYISDDPEYDYDEPPNDILQPNDTAFANNPDGVDLKENITTGDVLSMFQSLVASTLFHKLPSSKLGTTLLQPEPLLSQQPNTSIYSLQLAPTNDLSIDPNPNKRPNNINQSTRTYNMMDDDDDDDIFSFNLSSAIKRTPFPPELLNSLSANAQITSNNTDSQLTNQSIQHSSLQNIASLQTTNTSSQLPTHANTNQYLATNHSIGNDQSQPLPILITDDDQSQQFHALQSQSQPHSQLQSPIVNSINANGNDQSFTMNLQSPAQIPNIVHDINNHDNNTNQPSVQSPQSLQSPQLLLNMNDNINIQPDPNMNNFNLHHQQQQQSNNHNPQLNNNINNSSNINHNNPHYNNINNNNNNNFNHFQHQPQFNPDNSIPQHHDPPSTCITI